MIEDSYKQSLLSLLREMEPDDIMDQTHEIIFKKWDHPPISPKRRLDEFLFEELKFDLTVNVDDMFNGSLGLPRTIEENRTYRDITLMLLEEAWGI